MSEREIKSPIHTPKKSTEVKKSSHYEVSDLDPRIKIIPEGKLGTRPSWDEHGMLHAFASATRASCKHVRSGSALVLNHGIVGTGYNGAPSKIKHNCLETGCRKENKGLAYEESLGSGECIGVHSEKNALRYAGSNRSEEFDMYNIVFPCHTCAKDLIPYTKRFVFKRMYSKKEMNSTLELLGEAKVEIYQLDLSPERFFDIYFNQPNVAFDMWSLDEKQRMINIFDGMK